MEMSNSEAKTSTGGSVHLENFNRMFRDLSFGTAISHSYS